MIYRILADYTVNDDRSMYTVLNIENTTVEITLTKSVASDSVFIGIKENGDDVVSGRVCTAFEYIYSSSGVKRFSNLKGDFFFSYITDDIFYSNFDYEELGGRLILFYNDMEDDDV